MSYTITVSSGFSYMDLWSLSDFWKKLWFWISYTVRRFYGCSFKVMLRISLNCLSSIRLRILSLKPKFISLHRYLKA